MILDLQDASKLFDISETEFLKHIKNGKLIASYVDGQYYINPTELMEWSAKFGIKPKQKILQIELPTKEVGLKLSDVCSRGGFLYDVIATNKENLLNTIVDKLNLPNEVNKTEILSLMLTREAMGTTAIGEGIAIPHVRSPFVLKGLQPSINTAYLAVPLEMSAHDGKPVDIIFTILSNSSRQHLKLLSILNRFLANKQFINLLNLKSKSEIILDFIKQNEQSSD